jgi:hypothetical protein
MGRKADMIRAELEVAELEEALLAAKVNGAPDDEYETLKQDLRDARRRFRLLRDGAGAAGVVVSPATVDAAVEVD